ncbi:MAG: hypothetical protein AAGI11_16940 [Pseudomonadota bacterium]
MKDYSGTFNADLKLEDLDHALLAQYGRDIMLANHIHDRSGLAPVAIKFGLQAQTEIACDEWMSTSPIYNARNRRALNIQGDNVAVALKGLQVDIGAPHNYLNFHYEVVSDSEGYFWTSTCGPYNHVRDITQGDVDMQTQICHHMEDPTFDATVMAVHPNMRCRPVFRPPHGEVPDRGPCKWRVSIEDDFVLAEDCPYLAQTSATLAAQFQFDTLAPSGDGLDDYSGEFKRDFCLEDLSHAALVSVCKEFMLDVFILNYAMYNAVAERHGEQHITEMAQEQYHHLAPVTVHRLRKLFAIEGDGVEAILKVLQLNPFTPRGYFDVGFAQVSENRGLVWLEDCAGYREPIKRGIAALMVEAPESPGFERLAQEVNAQVVLKQLDVTELASVPGATGTEGALLAWEIFIDPSVEPATRSDWADLTGRAMWDHDNSQHFFRYDLYDALKAQGLEA